MYSDLLDQLGRGSSRGGGLGGSGGVDAPGDVEPLVSLLAGKMNLVKVEDTAAADTAAADSDSKSTSKTAFQCTADTARGSIRLVVVPDTSTGTSTGTRGSSSNNNGTGSRLEWQWYNRRTKTVVDRFPIQQHCLSTAKGGGATTAAEKEDSKDDAEDEGQADKATTTKTTNKMRNPGGTFQRVKLNRTAPDRVYVWTSPSTTNTNTASTGEEAAAGAATETNNNESSNNNNNTAPTLQHRMYWMQDANPEGEEDLINMINEYLADPSKALPIVDPAASSSSAASTTTSSANNTNVSRSNNNDNNTQVDALSSILENLGMPQDSNVSTTSATTHTNNQLTLADLNQAMAGMTVPAVVSQPPSQQQPSVAGPPLQDVVTTAAVDRLLENDVARERLSALLPPDQSHLLRDNLTSPALQGTLRSLTQVIVPDDTGDWSGLASVLANFQLPSNADAMNVPGANPIQVFLDAVTASVQNDRSMNETEESKVTEESKQEDESKQEPS